MKIKYLVAAAVLLLGCMGCKKVYQVVIVNRYSSEVNLIEEDGSLVPVPANGVVIIQTTIENGGEFVFEVDRKRQIRHRVENVASNIGRSGDVYVIDLDPTSKDGAGSGRNPSRPYE